MPSKKQTLSSTKRAQALKAVKTGRLADQAKPVTEKQQLIDLLSGEKLVTVEKMSKTLGWQSTWISSCVRACIWNFGIVC